MPKQVIQSLVENPLLKKRDQWLAELAQWPHPEARMSHCLERAKTAPGLAADQKTDAHRIEGCLADLWIVCTLDQGRCWFQCDSNALVVKAMAHLLCEFYSGAAPADILGMPPDFLREAGLAPIMTANRRNALSKVWKTIRTFAANVGTGGNIR